MQQTMRTMALVPFLVINAFLLAMAGVAIFAGLHARRRAALVKSMPTSNIGMAEDGYRELEGTIEAIPGPPVVAPLTQTPCAWYHARVEGWERSSGSSNRASAWHTMKEATSNAPLLLRDSTGVCMVFPFMAEVTPTDKSRWTGASEVPTDRNPPRLGPTESTTKMVEVSGGPNRGSATAKSASTSVTRCSCWGNSRRAGSIPPRKREDDVDGDTSDTDDEDDDEGGTYRRRGRLGRFDARR